MGSSVDQPSHATRFEVLPFGACEQEAARLTERVRLTVTCSPRHGVDRTVEVAGRLRALGHAVVPHLAARMVRGRDHLDELLERLAVDGIDDVFLIGGDGASPLGPYASAVELLGELHAHPRRPREIGVAAYPEGHPLIDARTLAEALAAKSAQATYLATQLCFDADALVGWLRATREAGITLPAHVGIPGAVDRRRLLEVSMRVGVGPSVAFVRKQRGLRQLFGRPSQAAAGLHDALVGPAAEPGLGVAGLHYFTFNRLVETWAWERDRARLATAVAARE
jgi:methylenetetrahydrofolate reductase (NADPH)